MKILQQLFRRFPVIAKMLQIVVQTIKYEPLQFILNDAGHFTDEEETIMKRMIEEKFKRNIDNDQLQVIGCGTIGRVYRFENYAIKVKIPGIIERINSDLSWFVDASWYVDVITRNSFHIHRRIKTFKQTIKEQYDFKLEVQNIKHYQSEIKKSKFKNIFVPKVFEEYSDDNMIVFEFISGTTLSKSSKDQLSEETKIELSRLVLHNIFRYNLFHLDMHSGNIMIDDQKRIYVIDFGMCIPKLKQRHILLILRIVQSLATCDAIKVAREMSLEYFLDPNCTVRCYDNPDIRLDFEYHMARELHMHYHEPFDKLLPRLFAVGTEMNRKYNTFGTLNMSLVEIGATQSVSNLTWLGIDFKNFVEEALTISHEEDSFE